MTEPPTDDQPGFVAEEPEHCFACYRLIRPGQTYYLTLEHEVLCADCVLDDALAEGYHPREGGPGYVCLPGRHWLAGDRSGLVQVRRLDAVARRQACPERRRRIRDGSREGAGCHDTWPKGSGLDAANAASRQLLFSVRESPLLSP